MNDFKIDFLVQKSDFTYKKLALQLAAYSKVFSSEAVVWSCFQIPVKGSLYREFVLLINKFTWSYCLN